MYTANASPATLWACAVGLTIFAFPYERRCRTRRDYHLQHYYRYYGQEPEQQEAAERDASRAAGWLALLSALVAVVVVYVFSDGTSTLASFEVLLLYVSVPVAWFGDSWIACGLHAAGIMVYTIERLGSPFGFDLTYLTHWNVAATLLVVLVLVVTTGVTQLLYSSWCSHGEGPEWIEITTALGLVALVSMQLSLTIGSLGDRLGLRRQPFRRRKGMESHASLPRVGHAALHLLSSSPPRSWAVATSARTPTSEGGSSRRCGFRCRSSSSSAGSAPCSSRRRAYPTRPRATCFRSPSRRSRRSCRGSWWGRWCAELVVHPAAGSQRRVSATLVCTSVCTSVGIKVVLSWVGFLLKCS